MKKKVSFVLVVMLIACVFLTACVSQQPGKDAAATETESAVAATQAASEAATQAASEAATQAASEAATQAVSEAATVKVDEAGKMIENYTESAEVGPKKVVLMVKDQTNFFWLQVADEAQKLCDEWGWELEVLSPVKSSDNEEQIQLIEQSLLTPPDIYVLIPGDSAGIIPAIEEINEAGVPIINLNTRIKNSDGALDVVCYAGIENVSMAYNSVSSAVKMLAETGMASGKAIILEGTTGAQTSIDRTTGAEKAFSENAGWEVIDKQPTNFQRAQAMSVMQNLLQAHDHIDLVFCASAEVALGAYEAIAQANRQNEVNICTINAYAEPVQAIADKKILVSMDDNGPVQGQLAMQLCMAYFKGESIPENVYIDANSVAYANVQPYCETYGIKYPG